MLWAAGDASSQIFDFNSFIITENTLKSKRDFLFQLLNVVSIVQKLITFVIRSLNVQVLLLISTIKKKRNLTILTELQLTQRCTNDASSRMKIITKQHSQLRDKGEAVTKFYCIKISVIICILLQEGVGTGLKALNPSLWAVPACLRILLFLPLLLILLILCSY